MAIKTLRVFQEFTSEGYVPMPPLGNIDYGYTIAGTFPGTTPTTFQTDDPDIDVTLTEMTDFYVWIRSHGTEWNINYTRNVRVYPDSPLINNVVMGIIIANYENALPIGGTTGQILAKIDNTDYNAEWIDNVADWTSQLKHEVKAGVALTKGQAVYVSGADGTNMIVSKASNSAESTSSKTLGLIAQNLANNGKGFVITEGLLTGLNTSSATVGDAVWLGTNGNLIYGLANKPIAPAHLVFIGIVTRVNNNNGEIFIKVQNGFEIEELHDVLITNKANKDVIVYDSATQLWKNKNFFHTQGYLPYYDDTALMLDSPFWTNGSLVGLGTITPSALLHMKGTTAYTNVILDNNSPTGGGMFSAYQNGAETAMFGADAYYQTNTSIDAAIIAKKTGSGIQFYTNGSNSEKMGINSDGNVFVGQTPTYVAGATQLIVRGKTGAGYLGVNHYDMSIKGFMNTFNSVFQIGTSTFHSLAFLVENSERGRVNSSGRLLWGTTTDNGTDLVQINGSLIATSIKKSGGTSSEYLMADGSVTTIGSYVPTTRTLTINGTAYDLSADRSWTIATSSGTVTSVSATVPTGFAITGSPITSSGTLAIAFASGYSLPTDAKQTQWDTAYTNRITSASLPLSITANVISIAQATNASNGYLSSTDWATFNAKQTALSGTGFVKVSGTTISYDNTAYTPTSRLLTINGTAYDLSADRSWTITPGSGMRNVQTFTATASQTTFTITGGYTTGLVDVYVNGARLSTSDFTATNGTSVVLGVGVVTNDIVDIVAYTASATSGITGGGTSGYLAKWAGTTAINNSLIYDNGTNVGIGTASPSQKLEVNGAIKTSGNFYAVNNTPFSTNGTITYHDTVGLTLRGATGYVYDFAVYNTSSTALFVNPTGTTNMAFPNGNVVITGGNLGVGTSSPTAMGSYRILEVQNATGGIIRFTNTSAQGGYIAGNSGGMTYDTLGAFPHIFYTNGSTRMTITNGGDVGIGTSSPATRLHLNTSGDTVIRLTSSAGAYSTGIQMYAGGAGAGFVYSNQSIYVTANANGVYLPTNGTSWVANSDLNLKNIESYIENAIESIMDLKAIRFNWKADSEKSTNIGLIAQEVEKVYPELINKNREGYLGVRYTELIPILVKAIQELNAKIEAK